MQPRYANLQRNENNSQSVNAAKRNVSTAGQRGPAEVQKGDPKRKPIETFVVNLDLAPEDRWTALVKKKEVQIKALLAVLRPAFKAKKTAAFVDAITSNLTLPEEYEREMRGMGAAIGVDYEGASSLLLVSLALGPSSPAVPTVPPPRL